jgi:hypothetical protein
VREFGDRSPTSLCSARASPAPTFALVSAAAEWQHRNGLALALKGRRRGRGRAQTYSGKGTLRYVW